MAVTLLISTSESALKQVLEDEGSLLVFLLVWLESSDLIHVHHVQV